MRKILVLVAASAAALVATAAPNLAGATPGSDVRVTDHTYVSSGTPGYTDSVLNECSVSRGRHNEPTVAIDPRDTNVVLGSANDYCGVYRDVNGVPQPIGPIWLGYYRSTDGGGAWTNSLVPGYPGDTSSAAQNNHARTDGAGDPGITWDGHGRAFFSAETSNDNSRKTWGDVSVATYDNPNGEGGATSLDGSHYVRTVLVVKGSSAPNLLGVFNDKELITADHTGGRFDGNVYVAFTKFNGNGSNSVYASRSTDHGATFSNPVKISGFDQSVQDGDIAITRDGTVLLTYDADKSSGKHGDLLRVVTSTNGGATWSNPITAAAFTAFNPADAPAAKPAPDAPQIAETWESDAERTSSTRDCGDFASACASGYTFFRAGLPGPRVAADQSASGNPLEAWVVFMASKPGTETATDTSYWSVSPGIGAQAGAYMVHTTNGGRTWSSPALVAPETTGHQIFASADADHGTLAVVWNDSVNDPCYSATRPIGNCADRTVVASIDTYGRTFSAGAWGPVTRLSTVTSNPDYEMFAGRSVPFWGDYIDVSTINGHTIGVWTDGRDIVPGSDAREQPDDNDGADVLQCRAVDPSTGLVGSDTCPRSGGLDQGIYSRIYP